MLIWNHIWKSFQNFTGTNAWVPKSLNTFFGDIPSNMDTSLGFINPVLIVMTCNDHSSLALGFWFHDLSSSRFKFVNYWKMYPNISRYPRDLSDRA